MKKIYLPIALLAVATLFAGCMGEGSAPAPTGTNCGTDTTCLFAAVQACTPAYGTTTEGEEGMKIHMYYQVIGGTTSACQYYMRVDSVDVGSGVPAAQKAMVDQLVTGKDMTCTMEAAGDIGSAVMNNKCTGSLVAGFKMLYGAAVSNPSGGDSGYSGDTGDTGSSGYGGGLPTY